MSIDISNIELGEGLAYITYGVAADGTGGTLHDVGATLGAEFALKKSVKEIEIGQVIPAVKAPIIGEEGTFKIKMMEAQLKNIVIAMAGDPGDISANKYVFGNRKTQVYSKIEYEVQQLDDDTKWDKLTLYRAIVVDFSGLPFAKSEERAFEVTFKAFPITPDWRLGEFEVDITP